MRWNNKTLVAIFIALAVILLALMIKDRSVQKADDVFMIIDSSKVAEVSIQSSSGNTVLRKEGTEWRVKEPRDALAQNWSVESMLGSLDTMEVEYVVSDDPAKHKDYQVDDQSGAKVKVKTDKGVFDFIVGSLGPTWRHTHMRKPGDNKVYLVKGAIRSSIVKKPDDWRDRKVYLFNNDSLVRMDVRFADKKGNYRLTKSDSSWQIEPATGKKFKPDENAMIGVLSGLLKLQISEFVPDSIGNKLDWANPLVSFDFEMKDGKKFHVGFNKHPTNEQQFCFRHDNNPETYAMWKGSFEMMSKKSDELTKEAIAKKQKREQEGMAKAKAAAKKDVKPKKAAATKK